MQNQVVRQPFIIKVLDKYTEIWSFEKDSVPLQGIGDVALLSRPLTAFFASRRCPGAAIRAATDWTLALARAKQPVVSGFHSPLEQSVLTLLLQARCPVVAVIARPLVGARLDSAWQTAIAERRMAVVTSHTASRRLTETLAVERNDLAALLATRIVIAHAEPGGSLSLAQLRWRAGGDAVELLSASTG